MVGAVLWVPGGGVGGVEARQSIVVLPGWAEAPGDDTCRAS